MRVRVFVLTFLASLVFGLTAEARNAVEIDGLDGRATIVRDADGIVHIVARTERDLFFLQGWVHARDRLFQMDTTRQTASGTLAELLGQGALATDVQPRTFGLRRAAERGFDVLSPEAQADIEAYAAGVNAYALNNPLPPEYLAPGPVDAMSRRSVADDSASRLAPAGRAAPAGRSSAPITTRCSAAG